PFMSRFGIGSVISTCALAGLTPPLVSCEAKPLVVNKSFSSKSKVTHIYLNIIGILMIALNGLPVQYHDIVQCGFFQQRLHHVTGIYLPFKRIKDQIFL